ncbi:LOW QUALITY PROTEIN: hypothetical protein HID58_003417 [Brassica napus]|uniref:Uncharacterized protein n=1 Tax=Brassica napus TaxID=3708 RepID=A0ABQ8ET35_BRANA|nr:LOW QUALITY PROTEIN: hypothetical protein HID58_003417 [Brassica napus]
MFLIYPPVNIEASPIRICGPSLMLLARRKYREMKHESCRLWIVDVGLTCMRIWMYEEFQLNSSYPDYRRISQHQTFFQNKRDELEVRFANWFDAPLVYHTKPNFGQSNLPISHDKNTIRCEKGIGNIHLNKGMKIGFRGSVSRSAHHGNDPPNHL